METNSSISSIKKDPLSVFTLFSLDCPISRLGFSPRSFNALYKNGYDTLGKILTLNNELLTAIGYLGEKSIKEIQTIQKLFRKQSRIAKEKNISLNKKNVINCRLVYSRETIYPNDHIGILDISPEAHNVLYNAGIFSAGKIFDMEKKAVYKLKHTNKEISEEILAFIAKEKPYAEKITGDEDLAGYTQKMTQKQQNHRMSILEESFENIPQNRLDIPISLYLQCFDDKNFRHSITRVLPILKKVKKVSELKKIFADIVKTSRTGDVVRILEVLSINFINFLNEFFKPFFIEPRYTDSLAILCKRANGIKLKYIAEKRNLCSERVRQIESKSVNQLIALISYLPVNIISFICTDTGNNNYISLATIREYLKGFEYASMILYLLKNENIYKEYKYNKKFDVFYRSGLDLDFSSLDIRRPAEELVLKGHEIEAVDKIEDFLIMKNLAKCTYTDIYNFIYNKLGFVNVGKILQLTKNIVEIEKDRYLHRSCIIDFDAAVEKLLVILKEQFRQFHGYSNSRILFNAVCIDLAMFMNDNGFETEQAIYMLVKHIFFKEKYKGHQYFFTQNIHIWEKQTEFRQNYMGVFINLAKFTGGIITRKETENYLDNLRISKKFIIHRIHNVSDPTFYFYKRTTYILSEQLQINNEFISKVKESLDRLFIDREYIIPEDIDEEWFYTLPKLPMELSWNLLLLQEIIKYNEEIGYKPLFADIEQSPYRISGAFVKINSVVTLTDIIYIYTYENFGLPYRGTTKGYRYLLREAGFIHDTEWFGVMHKALKDKRFVFSNENKNILIRKCPTLLNSPAFARFYTDP